MTRNIQGSRKGAKGGSLASVGRRRSPTTTIRSANRGAPVLEKAIGLREGAADVREGAADARDGAADVRDGAADVRDGAADAREQAADVRESAADQREGVADARQGAADTREGIADAREGIADLREDVMDLREEAADLREAGAARREKILRPLEQTVRSNADGPMVAESQLREANERLVIATVKAQMMTEAAQGATARMAHMASHDFLTGLPNRSVLNDRLGQAIAHARRNGGRVALMYLDLDNFKNINDSLGHAVGDELLRSAAKRLQASVRSSDTVSRQGGDEFVVLLTDVEGEHGAARAAEKLIDSMAEPHLVAGHRLCVTSSIGISTYPDDGMDAEALIKNADTAMYHAKRSGRNNYQAFTGDMSVRAVARQSVEVALHQALDQNGFVLHYQTQVQLDTGAVTGAEALVRLKHTDRRLVYPAQFVSVAEESGVIVPLGRWVMGEACRQTQAWQQAGLKLGRIAVNVSATELLSKDYFAGVRTVLDDTGLDPHILELELTESGLIKNADRTMKTLMELKALGVRIAIDDFGTGYSSLSHLRRLPIDTLKIDRSFVHALGGAASEAIVRAVIAMGASLEHRIVAKGVETPQQIAFLRLHGCAEGQGYFFSRPEAADKVTAVLSSSQLC